MSNPGDVTGLRAKAKALEDSFFTRENERLLAELRQAKEAEKRRAAFRDALNIENEEVLDAIINLDLDPETAAAFGVVPLIEVAWADGEIHDKERSAIMKAAQERGIVGGTPTFELLEDWLTHKPGPELMMIWTSYSRELIANLDADIADALRSRVLARARGVAAAAGGFLGMASISDAEQAVLDEVAKALE